MGAITQSLARLPLLHSPSPSSLIFSKFHRPPPRNFSAIPLCSSSDQTPPQVVGATSSIVGDLLDYLNESWTPFHATGMPRFILIHTCIS